MKFLRILRQSDWDREKEDTWPMQCNPTNVYWNWPWDEPVVCHHSLCFALCSVVFQSWYFKAISVRKWIWMAFIRVFCFLVFLLPIILKFFSFRSHLYMTLIRCPPSLFFGEKREDDMYHWTPYPQEHAQFINFSTEGLEVSCFFCYREQCQLRATWSILNSLILNVRCFPSGT